VSASSGRLHGQTTTETLSQNGPKQGDPAMTYEVMRHSEMQKLRKSVDESTEISLEANIKILNSSLATLERLKSQYEDHCSGE
jgi:hypothetical protein